MVRWECVLFLTGLLLADIDFLREVNRSKNSGSEPRYKQIWLYFFFLGLYFCSYPKLGGLYTPGFRTLATLTPHEWLDHRLGNSIGAIIVVWSIINSHYLARLFRHDLRLYLGKISYGLYLIQGPVLSINPHPLIPMVWQLFKPMTDLDTGLIHMIATVVAVLPALLWASHSVCSFVDILCTAFIKWAQNVLFLE